LIAKRGDHNSLILAIFIGKMTYPTYEGKKIDPTTLNYTEHLLAMINKWKTTIELNETSPQTTITEAIKKTRGKK
jgi:inosine-uridine nucleoside N-ribohydrolase